MKDVLITLQDAVLSNLQNVWMDDEPLDCTALQTASDDSRVNAMVCLGQLSQRISAAAAATARLPRENMLYPVKNDLMPLSPSLQYSSSRSTQSSGGSSSQPMTPEPLMDRITQMTQGQYVQKQPYGDRAFSISSQMNSGQYSQKPPYADRAFSIISDVRGIYPPRSNEPRIELGATPGPLRVQRPSNGSIEGFRRPSSQALSPEDTAMIFPPGVHQVAPQAPQQATQATVRSGSGMGTLSSDSVTRADSDVGEQSDRGSIAQGNRDIYGERSPEISLASNDGRSYISRERDRFNSDDYSDFNYSRGALDDPNLNYGDMYGRRHAQQSANRPPYLQAQRRQSSDHSTLEHVVYLQSNARSPAVDSRQVFQSPQSPPPQENRAIARPPPGDDYQSPPQSSSQPPQLPQLNHMTSNLSLERSRPVPYRVHDAAQPPQIQQPATRERTSSLRSGYSASERASSLLSPLHENELRSPPLSGLAAADAADKVAYKKDVRKGFFAIQEPRTTRITNTQTGNSPRNSISGAIPHRTSDSSNNTTSSATPAAGPISLTSPTHTLRYQQSTLQLSSTLHFNNQFSLTLPTEQQLQGFCKGAIKLQSPVPKDQKKAFSVANRPAGLTGTIPFWQCAKCSFEGPCVTTIPVVPGKKSSKPEKCFDAKVRVSETGIRYRWIFLAKSHILLKSLPESQDGSFGAFGCIFCTAEGRQRGWRMAPHEGGGNGAPIFGNVGAFMEHLQMHREEGKGPGAEMQVRARCVIGRIAEAHEDFDINLPPL